MAIEPEALVGQLKILRDDLIKKREQVQQLTGEFEKNLEKLRELKKSIDRSIDNFPKMS